LAIALILLGAIAIVALVVAIAFVLGVFEPAQPTAIPTQTPQIVVATTVAPPATATPTEAVVSGVDTPIPEATPVPQDDLGEMLTHAETLTRRSKFEEAIAVYEDLAQQNPEDARPEIGWAWALIWDDESAEALPHAQRAAELEPDNAEAVAVLARALIETGDEDQALVEAQRAVELGPGSATAHTVLAEVLVHNGRTQDAVDEADLALVQDINNAEAHRVRGWIYHIVDNDMGRAAGELQIAAGLQPELWLRRHELGALLLTAEDYTTAIMAFQDALNIRPKPVTYTAIGEAYYRLGQYDQAKASLDQALVTGAEDLNTLALAGVTYARLGRCDEAKEYYDQALAMEPTEPLALEAEDFCEGSQPSPTPSVTTVSASVPTPAVSPTPSPTPRPTSTPQPPPSLSGRFAFPAWNTVTRKYDIYIANADGSGRRLVIEGMHQPALSPDGQWLAVHGDRRADHLENLFIVRPNGADLKEISKHIEDSLPFWSPDSESLVFSSTMHGDKQSRVYIIDEVPFLGRSEEGRALNFGPDEVRGEYPTWSPDDQIIYKGCDLTVEPAKCGIYSIPSPPGKQPATQLTEHPEDTAPAAHGTKIAFMSNRDGNWEIYVMNNDGSGVRRLTNNAANDGLPVWSPDGRSIGFVSDQGGAWSVWVMSSDGSNRRKLFPIGNGGLAFNWQNERISWGP
jgi:tetratricopeptide (TPR) repeat protein